MKKFLAIIMTFVLVLSLAACSSGSDETKETNSKKPGTSADVNDDKDQLSDADTPSSSEAVDDEKNPLKDENTHSTQKPETNAQSKPEANVQSKPENNGGQSAENNKPASKPEDTAPKTVGNILLADFKAKASSLSALPLAEALVANPVMADIMAGAMEVEPGFLTGFDNNEITGFKSGAVFMPMIGTIPFVGYVFELEDGMDAASFISNLKSSANLRWNICTTADEMVSGSVGNKVFFVMCPTSFEQE